VTTAPAPARRWLAYTLGTTACWGVWGALVELPEEAGFPATLGYVVWSLVMLPPALALAWLGRRAPRRPPGPATEGIMHAAGVAPPSWLNRHTLGLALLSGLSGAGGQLALFQSLRHGPAYLVFPIVSLYPVVTVVASVWLLRERAAPRHWIGIGLALPAVLLLGWAPASGDGPTSGGWMALAALVLLVWGVQGVAMKKATAVMSSERLFGAMAATGVLLAPVALLMTDFDAAVNWGLSGAGAMAAIHVLNALGALGLVLALRQGPALIVVPLTSLAPLITVVFSLVLHGRAPLTPHAVGMGLAALAIYLLAT
jgi:drug/metabolite transporter (DMT)-like permease